MKIRRFNSFEELKVEIGEKDYKRYPFSEICYFEIFAKHFCQMSDIYVLGIYDEENLICYGLFEKIAGDKVIFLGMKSILSGQEVTDFGELVWLVGNYKKEVWDSILDYFKGEEINLLQLDYLREDSESYKYFSQFKDCEIEKPHFTKILQDKQETSPFIDLSKINNWEEYLMSIERKKRKELRRKIKRLEEKDYEYEIIDKISKKDFEDFVRLHRLSDSQKQKFMSEEMKEFFSDFVFCDESSWEKKLAFLKIDRVRVASLLYFEKEKEILLYNSGFDPKYGYYSVGLMLISYILKMAIENRIKKYDFLRGDERYKYDLGAKDFELYKIKVKL